MFQDVVDKSCYCGGQGLTSMLQVFGGDTDGVCCFVGVQLHYGFVDFFNSGRSDFGWIEGS
jgi:hypothetical protein